MSAPARLRLVPAAEAPAPADATGGVAGLSDEQLVALVLRGDRQAFESLYRRHVGFALNLAVRLQGSGHDVEDVAHDAFMKAHARLEELRDPASFRAWLGAIVVRLVRTRLRRRRFLGALGLASGVDPVDLDAIASTQASPESRAELAQIYALLQVMPADERIAWTLRHVESHRLETVAELTDCSLATAKRRIVRAQRFLSQHFVSPVPEMAS
jgi:RNA polymerase sigma-70 factor, ECF subfamily